MASRVPQRGAARVTPPRTSATAVKGASADNKLQRRPASTAAFSVRTDSDRVIHVYSADRTSSGGSASARSPASSGGSRSFSSDSWSEIDDDDIEPSDSASRSRHPSRRHTVEARPAPTRRQSSRRVVEREEIEEPRRRHSSRRHHSRHESRHDSRHGRSSSRRVPSDESSSSVASPDDYPPYGHHGMPHAPYPHSGYRHVPAGSRGGYPPSVATGPSGYPDPYGRDQQLVSMRHDPFVYPSHSNPFSPHSQQQNPFSPIRDDQSNYFSQEPMGPPPPRRHPSEVRRPQSFAAPSHYETETTMMAPYAHPYPPGPWGMPGYPPYPPVPGWPHSAGSSPPPKEEKNAEIEALRKLVEKRNDDEHKEKKDKNSEIEALKELIKKHEEERVAREKAWIAEREAEAAAKAAEKAKAEEEKKRKAEIDEAKKKAKEDAEKKAEEAAKKAKEEHEKKLAESEKAKEEAAKKAKELEDEIAKNKPTPDSLKAPIRFKDAVGRKFSFPWHICKTWKGMETLIKQAFLHVDMIGEHVHQGHYDLTGPDGEIILPQVWDTMVQPDWEITMHLWPVEEEKKPPKDDLLDPFANLGMGGAFPADFGMLPEHGLPKKKGAKGKDGKAKKPKGGSPEIIDVFPGEMPGGKGGMPPPPPPGFGDPFAGMGFPGMPAESKKPRPKSKSVKKEISPLAAWFAGGAISNSKAKRSK
ncbi:hypothetical protein HII31_10584 [Pseudocercospora fuligena]|uniref:Ubiquitin-like domain-containing protein n=1 Tax=Pseudocercospora fuligena TaxID=685502 RepID=A0A8H6VE93_9PEZI|nr:hypothetical protein HII31_10584 [Pseudocercospora fuligena]